MFVQLKDLPNIREAHRNEKIVLVGGCYDLLHVGHAAHLQKCAQHGDILVVAVVSDERTRRLKGVNRPIIAENDRAKMVSYLAFVNYSLVAPDPDVDSGPTTQHVLEALRPDLLITSEAVPTEMRFGAEVIYIGETRLHSTTEIIEKMITGRNS
jgi:cytidyltransferase-like protein